MVEKTPGAAGPAEGHQRTIDLTREPEFRLGTLRFVPSTRQLEANGAAETLEPRVMQVLALLADRRGEVVSRDDLVEGCWQGRAVSEDAINRSIAKVRQIAETKGGFQVETIPRVGYRLTELGAPVRPHRRRIWLAALLGGLLLIAVAALSWVTFLKGPAETEPPSLAVLPFRNLSPGDDYFAEGVAEEILTQLAGQPGLRVAGRTSSWTFRDNADLAEIGRRLDVGYVLEGSVRRAGGRVRVDVALVDVRTGMRRWSEGFQGSLDDIFAIQSQIGAAVAGNLRREIVLTVPPSGSRATSGDVHGLYLTARALLREREAVRRSAARQILERAVRLDPNYAPAWASLATAWASAGSLADRQRAMGYARRALALAPDLPEAHGVIATLIGFEHPAGRAHLRRAVALDPNDAELQFWLGHAYGMEGDFPRQLEAYRRAMTIDPLWERSQVAATVTAWEMGYRGEALRRFQWIVGHGDPYQVRAIRAEFAEARGDFSAAAREYLAARSLGVKAFEPTLRLALLLLRLNDVGAAHAAFETILPGSVSASHRKLEAGQLLSRDELRTMDRSYGVSMPDSHHAVAAAKRLVGAGRSADVVELYDHGGILGMASGRPIGVNDLDVLQLGIVVAALRDVGRADEAGRLLARADALVRAALSRGRIPNWFHVAGPAQVLALQGRRGAAIDALERAIGAGWVNARLEVSSDLGEEPAFRALRGDPRFERIRLRVREHIERERRELGSVGL